MYDDGLLGRLEAGLRATLPRWGLAPDAPLRLLTISENATFLAYSAEGQPVIYRVHRPGYHTAEEIRSELAWIIALHRDEVVATPRPIPMLDGELLGLFDDDGGRRHVVAFAFMDGREPEPGADLPHWYRALGSITARLHDHARRWCPPAPVRRKTWDIEAMIGTRPLWGDWRAGIGLDEPGRGLISRAEAPIRRHIAAYMSGGGCFGLIHADLRPANLLVDGGRLAVIDFDDCGFSWFMYDFAAAVSFMEHEAFLPDLQESWLAGYAEVAAVRREDREIMPTFLILRRILLTAWVASHAETPTAKAMGDPFTRGTLDLVETYLTRHA
jgi:Ser/Thr protein kinase RdoA (MazF antagonist)